MNKSELVTAVAAKCEDLTMSDVEQAVNAMLETTTEALAAGKEVKLKGFGGFEIKKRDAYQGRNPRTGEPVAIPASKVVKFKPAKALRESVKS